MKLYRLVQLYDQVMEELRVQDGHNDYMTVDTYPVIEGVLHSIKAYAAKIYTRICYELLCKEMTFESMYVVKGEKKKSGGPEERIYYWLQDVECENMWYIVIKHNAHEMMYCSCIKFELAGLPCRRMFAVMKYANMKHIPRAVSYTHLTLPTKRIV